MSSKILIRVPNHLGDCVMALPMVNEAREAYPGGSIWLLVPEPLQDLYRSNPAVDEIIPIPKQQVHGLIAVFKIKDLISRHGPFDIGYILPPSFGAASGFKLAGVRQRVGYIADGRRLLLTKPLPLPTPLNSSHRSETYFNLLRRGSGKDIKYTLPKLFVNDDDAEAAVTLLEPFGLTEDTPYAVMAHRAVAESRRWGAENYTELAKQVVSRFQMKVVLVGTEDDRPDGRGIAEAGGREVINLAGKTTLRELAAVMSRARLFVGNDSGPAHLAASVGIPIVVLSGADDPNETSPVSHRKALIYQKDLDCVSCVKNVCPEKGDRFMRCMKQISVEMVISEIEELLSRS